MFNIRSQSMVASLTYGKGKLAMLEDFLPTHSRGIQLDFSYLNMLGPRGVQMIEMFG